MPVQNAGDVILVSFDGFWHNQRVLNTFYYGVNTAIGAPTTTAFGTALQAALSAAGNLQQKFLACCPNAYLLNNMWVQTVAPVRIAKQIFSIAASGTFISNSTTANVASVVTRKGALANKHNIGSLHVPASNNDPAMSNGTLGVGILGLLTTLSTQMLASVTVGALGNVIPILWHKPLTANAVPITDVAPQLTVRVMRRRTVGVGK